MVNADNAVENDPLANYSLFPFNLFRSITNPNLGSPLSRLKNLVLRNPDALLKQAKTIIDSSMDHVESDKAMDTVYEDNSNVSGVVNDKNPQESRPALGLKRAKFSVKPMPSQTNVSLEPTLDIDKLKDLEEFFAASERIENSKEELRRLKGQPVVDIDQNRASLDRRHPKPSLARNTAIYKHRSYSLTGVPDNDESLTSYEEAYDHSIISPTREDTIPETNAMNFSPQTKVSDVDPAMSSQISELDELLSYDYEGLDEDGVQSLLQDKLNIKLVNIGKPSFPSIPNARRHEYESFIEALPDVENSSKAACGKPLNISNQYRKSSNIQVSPPLCKSPLASISTLHKHIARLTPLKDPFSPEDIDSSPEGCYYTQAQNKKQGDRIGAKFSANKEETNECGASPCIRENLFDIRFPSNGEHNLAVFGEASLAGIQKDVDMSACREDDQIAASPKSFGKDAFNKGCGVEVNVNEGDGEMGEALNTQDISMIKPSKKTVGSFKCKPREAENSTPVSQENINVETVNKARKGKARSNATVLKDKHAETEKSTTLENINVETVNKGRLGKARSNATVLKDKREETEKPTSLSQENINMETVNKARKRKARSNASVSKDKREKKTKKSTSLSEENINVETVNRARKMKARSNATGLKESKNKKRKVEGALALPTKVDEQLVRHSLKEAGTKWEVGVRRSTRIRMRPLEFWKGERFLYGRVHESLVSVIGVKYASPAKNTGERVVKVKSFVPNDYKDMVDLASSY